MDLQADTPRQAILYAAKSSPDERESIPDQLRDARAFAEREGMVVVAEYSEEDVSAYKGDRGPELAAAIEHAERLGAALIVQHSDRLARGDGKRARHLAELYFSATRAGVRLRSVQDDSTFDSPILAVVMGERNTEDSRRKGLAVRAGQKRRRKRGMHKGGPVQYGYVLRRNEEDVRMLVPNPEQASVVQLIFAEFLAGQNYLAIARALTVDGIPAPGGGKWSSGTVRRMLGNPTLVGLIRDGDELIPALHEPIIDRETWDRAATLLYARFRTRAGQGRPAGKHLFRKGLLRCGECGASIVPRSDPTWGGAPRESYRCLGRLHHPQSCSMRPINRAMVDDAVYAYFDQVGLDVAATRKQLADAVDRKLTEAQTLFDSAEQEEREAEARLARVKGDYTRGDLTAAEWRELREELEPEVVGAKAETERLRLQLADAEAGKALIETEKEVLEALASIREALVGEIKDAEGAASVRAVLMRLFDGFVLHKGSPNDQGHIDLNGTQHWIEPLVSDHTLAGYEETLLPVFAQKSLDKGKNNYTHTSL